MHVDPPSFRPHSNFGPVFDTNPFLLGRDDSHPSATLRDSVRPSSLSHLLLVSRDPALPSTSDSRQSPLASRPSNSYPSLTFLPPARSTLATSRSTSRPRPSSSSGSKPKSTPEFPYTLHHSDRPGGLPSISPDHTRPLVCAFTHPSLSEPILTQLRSTPIQS